MLCAGFGVLLTQLNLMVDNDSYPTLRRSGMDDLMQWLGEQLDEDERTARATVWDGSGNKLAWELAASATIDVGGDQFYAEDRTIANHVMAHDPARVLREIDAKRQLVKLHGRATLRAGGGAQYYDTATVCRSCESNYQLPELSWPCPTLRLLALPYADRPGYRKEWRP